MNAITPPAKTRWNPWPVCIAAYFIVGFAGCAGFVIFCNRHPADLVASDYYEKEVRYQAQMDNMRRADSASVSFDADQQLIQIALSADPLKSVPTGSIQLYRPSSTTMDRQLKLETGTSGRQALDAHDLAPGLWKVRVSWKLEDQDYFIDKKVDVVRKRS